LLDLGIASARVSNTEEKVMKEALSYLLAIVGAEVVTVTVSQRGELLVTS